jgi:hypothetical protein
MLVNQPVEVKNVENFLCCVIENNNASFAELTRGGFAKNSNIDEIFQLAIDNLSNKYCRIRLEDSLDLLKAYNFD